MVGAGPKSHHRSPKCVGPAPTAILASTPDYPIEPFGPMFVNASTTSDPEQGRTAHIAQTVRGPGSRAMRIGPPLHPADVHARGYPPQREFGLRRRAARTRRHRLKCQPAASLIALRPPDPPEAQILPGTVHIPARGTPPRISRDDRRRSGHTVSPAANIETTRVVVDGRQEASDPDDGFLRVGQRITGRSPRSQCGLPA
jgi:hypothetical protein